MEKALCRVDVSVSVKFAVDVSQGFAGRYGVTLRVGKRM